jgi:uncharacterized membrane protein YdjX (TVP38/TMEM64 family)
MKIGRGFGKIAAAGLFATVLGAFFYFDVTRYLSLEAFKAHREALLAYTEANFWMAVALFIGIYFLKTVFALPGSALLSLAGGFLFGSLIGALAVILAATTGAALAFLAVRYVLRDWVEHRFGDRLSPIRRGFDRNAFHHLLTLRLIPVIPFFLVNLVSSLTRIKLSTYVAATALGIIPGSFVFANAGHELASINALSEIAGPHVLVPFVLLLVCSLAFLPPPQPRDRRVPCWERQDGKSGPHAVAVTVDA